MLTNKECLRRSMILSIFVYCFSPLFTLAAPKEIVESKNSEDKDSSFFQGVVLDPSGKPAPNVSIVTFGCRREKVINLVVQPKLSAAEPLVAKSIPEFRGIVFPDEQPYCQNQAQLICFYNYEERPCRRLLKKLADHLKNIPLDTVHVTAIDCSGTQTEALQNWQKNMGGG